MMKYLPVLLTLLVFSLCAAEKRVLYLAGESNAAVAKHAFRDMKLPEPIRFLVIPDASDRRLLETEIAGADLIIANGLVPEFRDALAASARLGKTKIHLLGTEHLRPRIPQKLLGHIVFPMEKGVAEYRSNLSPRNMRNLILYLIHKELDSTVAFEPPQVRAKAGLIDPFTGKSYSSYRAYRKERPEVNRNGRAVVMIYSAGNTPEETALLRPLADALEKRGIETTYAFGDEVMLIRNFLLDGNGKSRFDIAIAFSFKFKAGLGEPLKKALSDLDIPVVNALKLYRQTSEEWERSVQGMNNFSVAFAMIAPEVSGLIEPTLLTGRRMENGVMKDFPMSGNMKRLADRVAKWVSLRKKANREKRVALFFYHPEGGKQSIGASYLNVPRSIVNIVRALHRNGYHSGGLETLDEKALTDRLIAGVRNVGSWAPGELDELLKAGTYAEVPFEQYRRWFSELPQAFQDSVVQEWGTPEDSTIMTKNGRFIIPVLLRGNLAVLPEPMRGYLGDVNKLYHSRTLAPPHQYVAVYLYLRHVFRADAVIHLGRHGSQEWLPGKQLGLSEACAPAVLGGDMVSLYPYISDGIGEGILVKRRGAGVILSHLTPVLGSAGMQSEQRKLAALIQDYQSVDPNRKNAVFAELKKAAESGGFLRDAGIARLNTENLHQLQHYLEDLLQSALPFGLHSYGASPDRKELERILELSGKKGKERERLRSLLLRSGSDELDSLLAGLAGRFIPPGLSGDPVRSPESLPVGRNFYGFDPDKFPTRAAFANARKAVEKLIADYRAAHDGAYPANTAIVLWAGESVRTGGLNESIFLHLIGMEPEWDENGRIRNFRPVPAARLKRPRLDVTVTTSGAYRDQFAGLLAKLDAAQRSAAKLTDVENFLAAHNRASVRELVRQGAAEAEAVRQASRRIYFPAPGTYGVGVNRLAGASGVWESNTEIAQVYLERMSYGVNADGTLGEAGNGLRAHLKTASVVLHSRSSTLYGVTDIDDMFQYLGGLSLAVRTQSGRAPEQLILDNRNASSVRLTPLKHFIAAELRTRSLNPEWIAAQQNENYAGARMIARTVDNLWGWQSVTPENIDPSQWNELYEVYQKDRYRLGLRRFFQQENAWAEQSVSARMLEAVRKEFWNAPRQIRTELARNYAQSVIDNGVACCDHTCNNPLLHQMVVNLISVPGVMTPESVAKFQIAVERAAARELSEQIRERRSRQAGLKQSPPQQESAPRRSPELHPVKGYKMKEAHDDKTRMSSSGIRWASILALLALTGVFLAGTRQERQ